MQLHGFLRFDAYYDTARFNSVIVRFTVVAEDGVAASPNDEKWNWYAGATLDGPDNGDLPATAPKKNFAGYVGAVRMWSKTFRTGLDVSYWETQYNNSTLGNALRFDFYAVMDF